MEKPKPSILLMGLFVLLVFTVSISIIIKKSPDSAISGNAVSDIQNLPFGLNLSLVAFIGQWVILLLIVLVGYLKFIKHKKEEEEKVKTFVIPKDLPKSQTNLDVFYHLLQENKSLGLGIIAKLFNLRKEKALEWARILEEKNLVTIEYPAFSDPEVRIKGYKEEMEKEREQKKADKKILEMKNDNSRRDISEENKKIQEAKKTEVKKSGSESEQ